MIAEYKFVRSGGWFWLHGRYGIDGLCVREVQKLYEIGRKRNIYVCLSTEERRGWEFVQLRGQLLFFEEETIILSPYTARFFRDKGWSEGYMAIYLQ